MEELQPRVLLATPPGLSPQAISHIYGFDQIKLSGGTLADGRGQTIAIIVAGDNPAFVNSTDPKFASSDLHQFDVAFGLPDPPSFIKVGQDGGSPPTATIKNFPAEIALDVEWAHALAPAANILLVEANTSYYDPDLLDAAVPFAASQPGVSVVSMSFADDKTRDETTHDETTHDKDFVTPPGHNGVTFLAAAGDDGAGTQQRAPNGFEPPEYPSISPNVIAVGGTTLNLGQLDSAGDYPGETGWGNYDQSYYRFNTPGGGSGGGISAVEAMPAYQDGYGLRYNNGSIYRRAAPDVALNADFKKSPVSVYDSYDHSYPWTTDAGTSFATQAWAALIALADQARAQVGMGSLDGPTQTLPDLYQLPTLDFHDITTGNNGYPAGPGYDLVTGLGTPVASRVVGDLWGHPAPKANDDTYSLNANTSLTTQASNGVLANDSDGTDGLGEPLTATKSTDPAHGTVTLSPDGSFTYHPSSNFTGVDSFTYTIQDPGTGFVSTATVHLTVNQAPAISSAAGTTFTVGSSGNFVVQATGFPAPSLSESGALPSGITFNPASGVLAGTPAANNGGIYPLVFTASNGVGPDATQNFTLTVNQAPAISSATSTTFTVGSGGSFVVQTTGFPAPTLSESGALPSAITFNPDTGMLAGTPAAGSDGIYHLVFTASNNVGAADTQNFTLTVNAAPGVPVGVSPPPPPPPGGGGFQSISVAFGPAGQEVMIAVQQDGSLVLADASGPHLIPGSFRSASVGFSPSGQEMLAVVLQDGTLILADATGPHVIPGSFQSADLAFGPSGQEMLAVTEQDGTLILADAGGPHFFPDGFQSASVAFSPFGQEVLALVLQDGTLVVDDAAGPHAEPGSFRSASVAFNPFGQEVVTAVLEDGSLAQF